MSMELAYEERGSGPVMLFVHGFPLDRTMWIPQLAGLAKHRTCVAVDLRGHGLSAVDSPGEWTMDLFADDIATTLDAMNVEQVDLAGLSMGGYVSFAFWRKYPDRVRSLTLIDTKAEADSDEAKLGREKTAEAIAADGMEALYAGLGPKLLSPNPPADVEATLRRIFTGVPPEAAAAVALAMRDRPDSTPDLSNIAVPVLWLHGEQDQLMPIDGARASAATMKDATFVSIPDAGHLANLENPTAVNDAIATFLKGQ